MWSGLVTFGENIFTFSVSQCNILCRGLGDVGFFGEEDRYDDS